MKPTLKSLALGALTILAAGLRAAENAPYADALSDSDRSRLAALAAPGTLAAEFTERRYTPLKKNAVVVRGVVRIDRARGISLAYDQPGAPVAILDGKGLLLRLETGAEKTAPPEASEDLRLLRALLEFDLRALETAYSVRSTASDAGGWRLEFTRRPETKAAYQTLMLGGDATRLTDIELGKTPNLRTHIAISAPELNVTFTDAELARYFR